MNYKTLRASINRAKTNSLGRKRPSPQNSTNTSPEIDHLEMLLGNALEEHRNPSKKNFSGTLELRMPVVVLVDSTKMRLVVVKAILYVT